MAAAVVGAAGLYLADRDEGLRLGPVVWLGGFESGDLSQWETQSACTDDGLTAADVGNTCISVVTEPRRDGDHAARFRVGPHTRGAAESARAEVFLSTRETGSVEGQEWYYAWSTLFPTAGNDGWWDVGGDWNYFSQFHNTDGDCGAALALGVDATSGEPGLYLELIRHRRRVCGEDVELRKFDLGPLRFDHWYEFVLRVRWSSDPRRGEVELWLNGERVVAPTRWPTMHDRHGTYWKQGFYRGATAATNTVVHDEARRVAPATRG